jgi:hypothetical protein
MHRITDPDPWWTAILATPKFPGTGTGTGTGTGKTGIQERLDLSSADAAHMAGKLLQLSTEDDRDIGPEPGAHGEGSLGHLEQLRDRVLG